MKSLSLWLLFASLSGISAAEPPSPALDWVGEGEVVLTAGEKSTVQIMSRSDFPLDVRLSLIWSEEGGAKKPEDLTPEPATGRLEPESVATFSLNPVRNETVGSYTGVLLARAYRSGVLVGSVRRNVTFNVQENQPEAPKLRFLVGEIKLRKYLYFPLGDPIEGAFVPLKPGAQAPDPLPDVFLREEHGDIVKVTFDKPAMEEKTGLQVLPIKTLSDFSRAGTYSGTLQAPDGGADELESKTVTISVTTADHPFCALFAIVAALLLALRIQRYTGVKRPYSKLKQHAAEIGAAFNRNEVMGYRIADDLYQVRLRGLFDDIDNLKNSSFTSLDETSPAYLKVNEEIESLGSAVKIWNGFAEKLKLLMDALGSIAWDQVPVPPLEEVPDRPEIYGEMARLLVGGPLTVKELEVLAPQISEAPAALELWKHLNERSATLAHLMATLLQRLGPQGQDLRLDSARERIEAARKDLLPFWNRLWTDRTIDFPAENERLEEIEGNLWIEEDLFQKAKAARVAAASSEALAALAETARSFERVRGLPIPDAIPAEPRAYEHLARQLRARSRAAEVAISLLAFLIAVYTGLKAEYFDQPFGTWRDYVDIVVWAVTAQALSDLLLKALDRLWALGGTVLRRSAG